MQRRLGREFFERGRQIVHRRQAISDKQNRNASSRADSRDKGQEE